MPECKLCNKKVDEEDFLAHLTLDHDVKSDVQYEQLLKEKEAEDQRTVIYQDKIRALVEKLNKKEITPEEYRKMIEQIKM